MGLATMQAAAKMRQSLKGVFAWRRLRLTRQAFWKWQLCVFVHGGVHMPMWEVLGGRKVVSQPSRRSYARRHLSKLKQAVSAEDNPTVKCRLVSVRAGEGAEGTMYLSLLHVRQLFQPSCCSQLQDAPALPLWNSPKRPGVDLNRPQPVSSTPAQLPRTQSSFAHRRQSSGLRASRSPSSPLRFHEPAAPKRSSQQLHTSTLSSASKSVSTQLSAPDDTPENTSLELFTPNRSSKSASTQLFAPNDSSKSSSTQVPTPDKSSKTTPSQNRRQTTSKVRSSTPTDRGVANSIDPIVSPAVRAQCEAILQLHQRQILAVFSACLSNGRGKFISGSAQHHIASSVRTGPQQHMCVDLFFRALLSVHGSRTWLRGSRRFVVRALRTGVNASKYVGSSTGKRVEVATGTHERELTITAFENVLCLMASLCAV